MNEGQLNDRATQIEQMVALQITDAVRYRGAGRYDLATSVIKMMTDELRELRSVYEELESHLK
jgi:hypothetical protein